MSGATDQGLLTPYGTVRAKARYTECPAWKRTLDAYCERVEGA